MYIKPVHIYILVFISLVLCTSVQVVKAHFPVATVVRRPYLHQPEATPEYTLAVNLFQFAKYVSATQRLNPPPEALVFPEWSLGGDTTSRESIMPFTEILPDVTFDQHSKPDFHPCSFNNTATPTFNYISCLAQDYQVAICYNAYDRVTLNGSGPKSQQMCDKLSESYDCVFNTEICFDFQGYFVAKYYKTHPFKIFTFDAPKTHQVVTFRTHRTNTPIALFICFDILWDQPTKDIIAKSDARVILYSVAFDVGDTLGPSVFRKWSQQYKATIVAANDATDPRQGGIWSNGSEDLTTNTIEILEPTSGGRGWLLYGTV